MRMVAAFDLHALKKSANLSINSDLLAKAKALKINLSTTLEAALSEQVTARQRELWKQNNQSAIDAYNQLIEENGVLGDELRLF
jgi:antitoxin CcdA